MSNDWTGNSRSVYKTLGASNHTEDERQNEDYYATDPIAAKLLLEIENIDGDIWECASGENHLAKVFEEAGYKVRKSDIIKRCNDTEVLDFLTCNEKYLKTNIITNPPYKYAKEFIEKAMDIIDDGYKVCMFLKIQFLEGKARKELFKKYPPKTVWISSSRISCAKNGDFSKAETAVGYAWFIWERGWQGNTIVKWFN